MRDILPVDSARWRRLNGVFAEVVEAAGYGQIITPLLEDIGVFTRIGDATDVVTKEMYAFEDLGGRQVALRPEMTAAVCRSFAQHRPTLPWKVWYTGSNFRYEKPQRGRFRQFDQVGVEVLGVDESTVRETQLCASGFRPASLDAPLTGTGTSLGELIVDPDDAFAHVELKAMLRDGLSILGERDRLVLRLRFEEELSQAAIGERIGVSQMQVSRILATITERLRLHLQGASAA